MAKTFGWTVTLEAMAYLTVSVQTNGVKPTDEEIHDAARYADNHVDSYVEQYAITHVSRDEEEETTDASTDL
jgi:hypothetical protein